MFARLATLLAILAVVALTTVASAHTATLNAATDHAVHASQAMPVSAGDERSCDDRQHCASTDAGACEALCGGLVAFLAPPGGDLGRDPAPAIHNRPSAAIGDDRTPDRQERPPKLRLL